MKAAAVIKSSQMPKDMEERAVDVARRGLEDTESDQALCSYIKKTFEEEYGHIWHCFAGRDFGSFVTFETGRFIYFYIGQTGICLFGTT